MEEVLGIEEAAGSGLHVSCWQRDVLCWLSPCLSYGWGRTCYAWEVPWQVHPALPEP